MNFNIFEKFEKVIINMLYIYFKPLFIFETKEQIIFLKGIMLIIPF